ncbi:unnamed protein product [Nippostrongylus brasiliensis]|uniref:SH3 domain-containing protein n=1 Tax=Nippostrongylus brasiliensis TaxID=27835 RepID=A0A158QZ94_NIPBR|nr:unnamed protein product [Nippostrongylus brasiliensis]
MTALKAKTSLVSAAKLKRATAANLVADEVSMKKGSEVKALYREDEWLYVHGNDGKRGFVPQTYCTLTMDRGHGEILGSMKKKKEKAKEEEIGRKRDGMGNDLLELRQKFSVGSHLRKRNGELLIRASFQEEIGKATVRRHYFATRKSDVSVRRGEEVSVLNIDDLDWTFVRTRYGREGFVPANYLDSSFSNTMARRMSSESQHLLVIEDFYGQHDMDISVKEGEWIRVISSQDYISPPSIIVNDTCAPMPDVPRVGCQIKPSKRHSRELLRNVFRSILLKWEDGAMIGITTVLDVTGDVGSIMRTITSSEGYSSDCSWANRNVADGYVDHPHHTRCPTDYHSFVPVGSPLGGSPNIPLPPPAYADVPQEETQDDDVGNLSLSSEKQSPFDVHIVSQHLRNISHQIPQHPTYEWLRHREVTKHAIGVAFMDAQKKDGASWGDRRAVIISALVEMKKRKHTLEATHLGVYILDKCLDSFHVVKSSLSDVCAVSMVLGTKMEEYESLRPGNVDGLCGATADRARLCDIEKRIVHQMKDGLCFTTPLVFAYYMLAELGCDAEQIRLAQYILNLALLDSAFRDEGGPRVAHAAVCITSAIVWHKNSDNLSERDALLKAEHGLFDLTKFSAGSTRDVMRKLVLEMDRAVREKHAVLVDYLSEDNRRVCFCEVSPALWNVLYGSNMTLNASF